MKKSIYRFISSFLFVFFVLIPGQLFAYAEGFEPQYHTSKLENGATIVARHIPDSPLVTIQISVLSGLSNEGKYAGSGISHFLEHLLFKGTLEKNAEEIRKEIKAMGGFTNGSTGLDSAEYSITVPNEYFNKALALLISMVLEPVFTDGEISNERDVILNEIRFRKDDSLSNILRLLFAKSYKENVYKHPIIGEEEPFKKLTREDILAYHKDVYTPDRIVIGVVGGISERDALEQAEQALGTVSKLIFNADIRKSNADGRRYLRVSAFDPRESALTESNQTRERIFNLSQEATLGYLAIGFHTTDIFSKELYAGDILSVMLGHGTDSRLYKRLIEEKQLLYMVSCENYTPKYPGLFVITGIGDPEKLEEARKEIFNVINQLKRDLRDEEVERAKNLLLSQYFYTHEKIAALANIMTNLQLLVGSAAFLEEYVERVKRIKKDEIKRFIPRYLTLNNSTTVFLLPKGYYEYMAQHGGLKDVDDVSFGGRHPAQSEGSNKRFLVRHRRTRNDRLLLDKSSLSPSLQDMEFLILQNGLKIVIKRKGFLPIASIVFAANGGVRLESDKNNGISNLTASLILKGTTKRPKERIVPLMEGLGASINSFSGMNSLGVIMNFMSKDLGKALNVLRDVLTSANFPEEEITKEKDRIIAMIKEEDDDIFERGMNQVLKLIYNGHPYSMRSIGEIDTVKGLSREEIVSFYKRYFVPQDAVITIVGDIDVKKTRELVEKTFESWQGENSLLEMKDVVPLLERKKETIIMQKEQSLLFVAFQGVTIKDYRKYVLSVISSLLSGSDGFLFKILREDEGLTYASGAMNVPLVDPGYFAIYAATTKDGIEKTKDAILSIIENLKKGDILEDEINASIAGLISLHLDALQTNSSLALTMALDELYGLGFDDYKKYPIEIKGVSKEDIVKCANEKLDLDKSGLVTIHPEE